jgi:hypothetical protein
MVGIKSADASARIAWITPPQLYAHHAYRYWPVTRKFYWVLCVRSSPVMEGWIEHYLTEAEIDTELSDFVLSSLEDGFDDEDVDLASELGELLASAAPVAEGVEALVDTICGRYRRCRAGEAMTPVPVADGVDDEEDALLRNGEGEGVEGGGGGENDAYRNAPVGQPSHLKPGELPGNLNPHTPLPPTTHPEED